MNINNKQRGSFDRIVELHRPDCEMLKHLIPETITELDDETIENNLSSADYKVKYFDYVLESKDVYEDLKRIIGQLAGLLILGRSTNNAEFVELKQLDICTDKWYLSREKIETLKRSKNIISKHFNHLVAAHVYCGEVIKNINSKSLTIMDDAVFNVVTNNLKVAYLNLSLASIDEAGMNMVDFSNACCSCGQ